MNLFIAVSVQYCSYSPVYCQFVIGKTLIYRYNFSLLQAWEAEADCTKALSIEKDNVKALFRRAQARKVNALHFTLISDSVPEIIF